VERLGNERADELRAAGAEATLEELLDGIAAAA
jgi:hypothetical protein